MKTPNPAFHSLYNENFRKFLMGRCLRMIEDIHMAEDIVQETLLALMKCRSYDQTKSSPATYAIRRLKSKIRACPRCHCWDRHGSIEYVEPSTHDQQQHDQIEGRDFFEVAQARLSERHFTVFQRVSDGETQAEISRDMGLSKQYVSLLKIEAEEALTRLRAV